MNVQKKRIVASASICAVASVTILMLAPQTLISKVSLSFVLADIVVAATILWQTYDGGLGKYITNAAFAIWLWPILIISVIASLVVPFIGAFGIAMPLKWFCALQILALSFAGLVAFSIGAGQEAINDTRSYRDAATEKWTRLRAEIDAIAGRTPDSVKASVLKVRDAIRYADPVSDPRLASMEESLNAEVAKLAGYVDDGLTDAIPSLCDNMSAKIADMANRKKLFK